MAALLLLLNVVASIIVVFSAFRRSGGYLEFPMLLAMMYLVWFIPQAWIVIDAPQVDQGSLTSLLLFSFLCLVAAAVGWIKGRGSGRRILMPIVIPNRRLFIPVAALTAFSAIMQRLIDIRPPEELIASQWTGTITILAFFASVGVVSLVASVAMVLHHRTVGTVILAAANVALYMPKILVYFRRADIFEFGIAIALGLFFVSRKVVPRTWLVIGCLSGFFVVHGVAELRDLGGGYALDREGQVATRVPSFQEIADVDWLGALAFRDPAERSEVRNAVEYIAAIDRTDSLMLGAELWNTLVHAYVPGQFVGHQVKAGLLIGDPIQKVAETELQYKGILGITATGFVPVYRDFWFFGFVVFGISGLLLGRLFRRIEHGHLSAYLVYGSIVSLGIHMLTHTGYILITHSLLPLLACAILAWSAHSQSPIRRPHTLPPARARS